MAATIATPVAQARPAPAPAPAVDARDAKEEARRDAKSGADKTTIRVRGRSSTGPTQPDNARYGHWRADHHWPGDQLVEREVTLAQLDELKRDPWLALTYDAAEEELVRARTAPDRDARDSALEAAEAELQAAELSAKALSQAAQRGAIEAGLRAEQARAKIAELRRASTR